MNKKIRRRKKDNPYILIDDQNYIIRIKNINKQHIDIKVDKNIYDLFNNFELCDISEMHEYERHIEHNEVYDINLYKRAIRKCKSVEDIVEANILYEDLYSAIKKLPTIQKNRIIKYFLEGKNEIEIAKEEGCSHQSVHIIINRALENLKKYIKK